MLRTRGLTRRFGGLVAVDGVDFTLAEDELCSLIGPNGAGKTTFFDLLTGVLDPSAGAVYLREGGPANDVDGGDGDDGGVADEAPPDADDWTEITGHAPDEIARRGVHRSYQITNVFPGSTVLENVRVAAQAAGPDAANFWRNAGALERYVEEAHRLLDRVGLDDRANEPASALSHGAKRQLEVAIALAGDPDVLLLDEPAAGVSSESVGDIIDLIEDVAADHATLLVEHNMDIVMSISDRVVVLNQGAVIADGPPGAVRDDERVQQAYLGGYEAGDARSSGGGTATDGDAAAGSDGDAAAGSDGDVGGDGDGGEPA